MNIIEKIKKKFVQLHCARIFHKNISMKTLNKGIITIFHDYERHYHHKSVSQYSDEGVSAILEAEKRFAIKSTFNIVAKLLDDVTPVVRKIRSHGHDIASHSYSHRIMNQLNKGQLIKDIELSQSIFVKHGLKLNGLRSPQSKWCLQMLPIMLAQGLKWSAENDLADYPYIIYKSKYRKLLRMPIKIDDWDYEGNNITPNQMFKKLIHCVDHIAETKHYGAIGFHPWVQGKKNERMKAFCDFIEYVAKNKKIYILTFQETFDLFSSRSKTLMFPLPLEEDRGGGE